MSRVPYREGRRPLVAALLAVTFASAGDALADKNWSTVGTEPFARRVFTGAGRRARSGRA